MGAGGPCLSWAPGAKRAERLIVGGGEHQGRARQQLLSQWVEHLGQSGSPRAPQLRLPQWMPAPVGSGHVVLGH